MSFRTCIAARFIFPCLAALSFLSSCGSPSAFINLRSPAEHSESTDVWSALRSMKLEQGFVHPSPEVVRFTEGLSLILNGREREADEIFRDLMSSKDIRIRYYSDWVLRNLAMLPVVLSGERDMEQDTVAPEFLSSESTELPITWGRLGVPLVNIEINGRRLKFILDTGSSFTALDYASAKRCGAVRQEGRRLKALTALGSKLPVHLVFMKKLRLGGVLFQRHPVLLMAKKNLVFGMPRMVAGVDGVIGWNTLRHFRIELDTRRRVAILSPSGEAVGDRSLFWLGFPIVRVRGPWGGRLHFGLDTGVESSYITPEFLKVLHERSQKTYPSRIRFHRAWERFYIRTEVLPRLELIFPGNSLSLSNLFTMPADYGTFVLLDGIIGFNIAFENRVIIDLGAGSIEIVPWTDPVGGKKTSGPSQIF